VIGPPTIDVTPEPRLTEFDHFAFLTASIMLESAAFAPSGVPAMALFFQQSSKPLIITGIDVSGRSTSSEELMRILAVTFATATVLAFAFPQTPRVLAQGSDTGAVGRPLQLDGGPSLGSDNRGKSSGGGSERTEPSAGIRSEKDQTNAGKIGETTIGERSHASIGLSSERKHRVEMHRRGHRLVAFSAPRHRFAIHRHGHHLIAFSGSRHRS
jgi:hypothetical protein